MAIKGVSEVIRLPRLGKIRLGIKRETEDGIPYPVPTDYFVCTEEVRKVFGEKPKELRVMFPTEDEIQWASQFLRCYSVSRGLICRGDGETALARVDTMTGEITTREATDTTLKEISCHPDSCIYYQRGRCKRVMNLQFLLPDCPGFGVYQLDTSSFHSIVNTNSSLKLIRGICGRLSMIPLSLKLVEQEVQPEGKQKTIWVLNLTAPYTLAEIQKYAQVPPGQSLILPPPDSEAPDDLFPQEILGARQSLEDIQDRDEALMNLWTKAKSKVLHFDIQDSQIVNWFERNFHITVRLKDFDSINPPVRLTAEALAKFCQSIDSCTSY